MIGVSIEKMPYLKSAVDGDTGAKKVSVSLETRPSSLSLDNPPRVAWSAQRGRTFGGRVDAAAVSRRRSLSRVDSKSAETLALTGGEVAVKVAVSSRAPVDAAVEMRPPVEPLALTVVTGAAWGPCCCCWRCWFAAQLPQGLASEPGAAAGGSTEEAPASPPESK